MSIDHYYMQIDGNWVDTDMRVVNGEWEYIPDDERPDFHTDFWLDICHNWPCVDERYYFPDLASAFDFYVEGWKDRQYLHDDSVTPTGLDHSGLYSRGRLIHGRSIHGDTPGHEGENLRQICEDLARKMDEAGSG